LDNFAARPAIVPKIIILDAFYDFAKQESVTHELPRSPREMVSPSEDPTSGLALRGHYASFTTNHVLDGEMHDSTNPCIKLLIDAGLEKDGIF
jgi:hypothetical protein